VACILTNLQMQGGQKRLEGEKNVGNLSFFLHNEAHSPLAHQAEIKYYI
jgi:hypothetical protein